MRRKRIFSIVFAALFLSVFVVSGIVKAAGGEHGGGASGEVNPGGGSYQSGCDYTYNTCTGAAWKYYAWPAGANSVHIDGQDSSESIYKSADITGRDAEICKKAGGYYRYGMVNRNTGAQWGVLGISGNNSATFDSIMLPGGQMHYSGPEDGLGGLAWDSVVAAYNAATAAYGNIGAGFVQGSRMAWFCASYGGGNNQPCEGPDCNGPGSSECPNINTPAGYTNSRSNEGWSSVRTQVRNVSLNTGFVSELYAKPGDGIQWRHCYFPGMQKVADTVATTSHPHTPTQIRHVADNVYNNVSEARMKNFNPWTNTYNIRNRSGNSSNLPYNAGDTSIRSLDNNYNVDQGWVGGSSSETSSLVGDPWHAKVWTTGTDWWSCTYVVQVPCKKSYQKGYYCHMVNTGRVNGYQSGKPIYVYEERCDECSSAVPGNCNVYKTVYYDSICDETRTNTCMHATDLHPYIKDRSLYSGDKSSETATVKVPYNYNLTSNVKINSDVVYAGETASLSNGQIWSVNKWNSVTQGSYTTKAPVVKGQIVTFVSDTDQSGRTGSGSFREGSVTTKSGALSPGETWSFPISSVNVDDIEAGKYFCVALRVYPTNSGSDTNWTDGEGNHSWGVSTADCKPIAKRPSFQVWGNGVFSNGSIVTGRSTKNNLAGLRGYAITGVNDGNVFGSWAERSVMALGTINGFASGAATVSNSSPGSFKDYGEYESSTSSGFCSYEVALTFANYTTKRAIPICGSGSTVAGQFATSPVTTEKFSYIESVTGEIGVPDNVSSNETIVVGQGGKYAVITNDTGKNILYHKSSGNIHLNQSLNLPKGNTYVVHSGGTVTINGNITYQDGYSSLEEIPKLLIYAKNINILCGVDRIDAALIAEERVNTCSDVSRTDYNNAARSRQLRINGTIITNYLDLARTYGAGTGAYSGVPAEIVNYDSTLVLWARSKAGTSESGALNATYTRELAPRY